MAFLHDILEDLEAEIEEQIEGLEPRSKPTDRFRTRSEAEKLGSGIRDATGRHRIFQLGRMATTQTEQRVGSATVFYDVMMPLTIGYSQARGWHYAALGDFEHIRNYFATNRSTVPGVDMRVLDGGQPTMSPINNEPWFTMTAMIRARIEADAPLT